MGKSVLYKYDPDSNTFTPVKRKLWQRSLNIGLFLMCGILVGAAVYFMVDGLLLGHHEAQLREHNERLRLEINELQRQTDDALAVLKDIADRDNNFYRVLMQADPISDAQRYGGLQRDLKIQQLSQTGDDALIATLQSNINALQSQLYAQSKSFDFIRQEAIKRKGRLEYMPAIQPIALEDMEHLASGFGHRTDPVYGTSKMHEGIDYSAEIGTPVYATAKGTVTYAGWKNGYGNCVYVDHGYDYETRYGHLSEILVREGQHVDRGEMIGRVGNTGKSTGPHLHYEVRFRDFPQNPINYYFYDMTPDQYYELIRQAQNAGHVMD